MITSEKCSLRNESHMKLIRYFVAQAFDYRFKYWAQHIPGAINIEADNLSRFYPRPFARLYDIMRPIDENTIPFFNLNPGFNPNFSFKYVLPSPV